MTVRRTHRIPALVSVVSMVAAFTWAVAAAPTAAADTGSGDSPADGTATTLAFTTDPAGASGGTAFTTQPVVTVEDSHGDAVTTDNTTEVTLSLGASAPAGATLTCAPTTAVDGVATFSDCLIDKTGTYTVTATATGLTSANSSSFQVSVGPAAQLSFTAQPTDIVAGVTFPTAPALQVQDAGGNPVSDSNFTFGLAAVHKNSSFATLHCTGTDKQPAPSGQAPSYKLSTPGASGTFAECTVTDASTDLHLVGVAVQGSQQLVALSDSFDVSTGSAATLAFTTPPTGARIGQPFGTQPTVAVQDAQGNTITTSTATVTLATGDGQPVLACDHTSVQAVQGVAQFTGCELDATGNVTITATSDGLTSASAALTVSANGAAHVTFATQPSGGTAGIPLATAPVVTVADAAGHPVSDSVTLSLAGGPTGARLACLANPAAAPAGTATFAGCSINKPGTYTLVATVGDLTATSDTFDITAGEVASLAFTAAPTTATGGKAFGTQPAVTTRGAAGNPVTDPGASVTLSILPGTGTPGAALTCDDNPADTAGASATFAGCRIDTAGTGYRLVATAGAPGVAAAISAPFDVNAGDPTALAFSVPPRPGAAGGILGTQPQVTVIDAGGNPVSDPGVPITLTITSGSGTDGAALTCAANPATTEAATAIFTGCSIDTAGTGYRLTASATGLKSATSEAFSVNQGPAIDHAAAGQPLAQTFGGQLYSTNPSFVTDDVNGATGALQLAVTDLTVAGIGVPLTVTRSYNSADTSGGAFGRGWSSIFDAGVQISRDGQHATVRGEDGAQLVFTRQRHRFCFWFLCGWIPGHTWQAPAGATASLSCFGQNCIVTRFDGVSFTTHRGSITRYTAASGHGLRFHYHRGTLVRVDVDTSGRPLRVAVTENSAGHVTALSTPAGRTVRYSYTDGLLTGYTDADGNTTDYSYASQRLSKITDPTGNTRLSVTYHDSGRVATARQSGGPQRFSDSYRYDTTSGPAIETTTRTTTLTANGKAAAARYVSRHTGNVLISEQLPSGATTAYRYDADLNLVALQDPLGQVQRQTYDRNGNLTSQTTADGATVRLRYDRDHHVTAVTDADGNTTRYRWSGPNLVLVAPPGGRSNQTRYTYNHLGEMVAEYTPTSITTYSYDEAGNQTGFEVSTRDRHRTSVNGLGPVTTFNEAGQKLSTVDPRGHHRSTSHRFWDSWRHPRTVTDPDWATTYTYDADGHLLTTRTPGGQTTTSTYTPAGDVASTTLPGQPTTRYHWDESTGTLTATAGDKTISTKTFDAAGNLLTTTDAGGRTTSYTYNTSGAQIGQTDPSGVHTSYTYLPTGFVGSASDSTGQSSRFRYDSQNRVVASVVNGVQTQATYDPAGNVISTTAGNGDVTSYGYNNLGELAAVTTAVGTTRYGYDGSGNLVTVTDANEHTTRYTYDGMGHRTSMSVDGARWSYDYDVAGNLVSSTDPDGRTTSYTLDARDLRTAITYRQHGRPTITVAQQFDAAGRRTSMTDATGTHHYTYDAAGNLTSAMLTPTGGGAASGYHYDYSTPGQMRETYPDGTTVDVAFDDTHHVMSVDAPGVHASYLRDAARRITGIVYSNGVVTTQGYDRSGNIVSQTLSCAGSVISTSQYGHDGSGNALGYRRTVAGVTTTAGYGYDDAGRLDAGGTDTTGTPSLPTPGCVSGTPAEPGSPAGNDGSGTPTDPPAAPTTATVPPALPGLTLDPATDNPIGYDPVGNRTAANGVQFTYNAADEQTSGSDGSSATYDKAGNLISRTVGGQTTRYSYDAANRLATVDLPDGSTVTYTYDGDGNRVRRTVTGSDGNSQTTRYSWDISGRIPVLTGEYDGDGTLIRRYLYGAGPVAMQTPKGTYFYHLDPRGDITALTDATGAVVETDTYSGFGEVTTTRASGAPENPLLFQGQYLDTATGLYDMRARNYNPATGRFTQPDPAPPTAGTPAVSRYAFANNNPVAFGDPTGQTASLLEMVAYGSHATKTGRHVNLASVSLKSAGFAVNSAVTVAIKLGLASKAGTAARVGTKLGDVLGIAGIALSVYITVDDCMHGPVALCVADSVGTAVSIGCLAVTSTFGSIACVALGVGLSYVIANYGPQIAQAAVDLAGYIAAGTPGVIADVGDAFDSAGSALSAGFTQVGDQTAHAFTRTGSAIASGLGTAGGVLASGFASLGSAVTTGYQDAVSTLAQAGYSAAQLASVLAGTFQQSAGEVIGQLIALGYDTDAVASALSDALGQTAAQAAALLKSAGYGIDQIAGGLQTAYRFTDKGTAAVLAGLGYSADQIAGALVDAYGDGEKAVAQALQALGYGATVIAAALHATLGTAAEGAVTVLHQVGFAADQVASALGTVYDTGAATAANLLAGTGYTASQVAGALDGVYRATAQDAASILKGAGYEADQIATGLRDAFDQTDADVADLLDGLGIGVTAIASALQNVYGDTAQSAAQALKDASIGADDIADALQDVYGQSVSQVEDILGDIGFTDDAISDIGGAFKDFGKDVGGALKDVGKKVSGWF